MNTSRDTPLKICIVGKYPPIQGGVSTRTYWTAHALATLGHEVHVITNAKEATPPFRMHMRAADWLLCDASHEAGSVTIHWTDPVDRSQHHIPMASPFVSKLASIAAAVHAEHTFDVIFSHYLEPYGIAAHLAAQMTEVPHVARMAGSDAGRLWRHPQFERLYDHVLRSAEVVVAAQSVATRAVERGVDPGRVVPGGGYALPQYLFRPEGPGLDLRSLKAEIAASGEPNDAPWGEFAGDRPYFGIYGKLGESKGTFALLAALHRLKRAGASVGLVVLAHGMQEVEARFRMRVHELGLADRVLQIPFLPHWRVPEFLRGCLAVCCLEQNFPIGFHSPITPLEALLCGRCLIASTEVIRKLPNWRQLADGYNCVAIGDVNDDLAMSRKLAAIVAEPEPAVLVGKRGCKFAREAQANVDFPRKLERILAQAARRQFPVIARSVATAPQDRIDRFPLTRMVAEAFVGRHRQRVGDAASSTSIKQIDMKGAEALLIEINRALEDGEIHQFSFAQAVETEIAIAAAESDARGPSKDGTSDPLFRLCSNRWAIGHRDIATLAPIRCGALRILRFNYDVAELRGATSVADFPAAAASRVSYAVVFRYNAGRSPLVVDAMTAQFLELADGRKTVVEILTQLETDGSMSDWSDWVENLFLWGLIGLRQTRPG